MATTGLKTFPLSAETACPKCKTLNTLYDPEGSEFYVCKKCHSYIQFDNKNAPFVKEQASPIQIPQVLPLGAKGVLRETEFIVIAFVTKRERGNKYAWREYILYNYEKGYANLAEYDGHWNLVMGSQFYPDLEKLTDRNWNFIDYDEFEYQLFNKYTAETTSLIGELDWDLLNEVMNVAEFVAPPCMIFREKGSKGGVDFYFGEYIEEAAIAKAFNVDVKTFPEKEGIGANQPSNHQVRYSAITKATPLLMLLAAAIGFATYFLHPEKQLMNDGYNLQPDTAKVGEYKPFKTPSFNVSNPSSALQFLVYADVDNNWMEATVVLVNEQNNQTWEVTKSVEYYHGFEDGESWTEGSKTGEVLLSDIPGGKYHLNIYPATGGLPSNSIHVEIYEHITLWRNLLVTLLAFALYPVYCWYRMRNFEKRRWMNSDYSPYETDE